MPILLAEKKGYFEEFGVQVRIQECTHFKGILALLEAGRIDCGEVPTIAYLQESILKKSKSKALFKGFFLYHTALSFYSRFLFQPNDLTRFVGYSIPVPHFYSVERLYAEKFFEEYAPKNPIKIRYADTATSQKEKEFLKPICLGLPSDTFLSPFLQKYSNFKEFLDIPLFKIADPFPSTLLAFGGEAVLNSGDELSRVLLAIRKAIETLKEASWEDLDFIKSLPQTKIYPFRQLPNGSFSLEVNLEGIQYLTQDLYFRLIKRSISPELIAQIFDFTEILNATDQNLPFDVKTLKSFREPSIKSPYSPLLINYRKLNATRHLIVDVNSISLDVLQGNFSSRLNTEENLLLDNRVKILLNAMLDSYNTHLDMQKEEIANLENLISILEIKLDRSAVDLQYSEEKYRYLFEFSREAIAIVDADTGAIIESNRQFRTLTGYSRSDLSKKTIESILLVSRISPALHFGKDLSQDTMLFVPDVEILIKDSSKLGVDLSFTSILLSPRKRYQVEFKPNQERKEQERLQHEFISNISHELRSPMTNIRGYLEIFMNDKSLPFSDEHKSMLEVIDKNAKRLSFLIENLLKLTTSREKDEEMESMEFFDPSPIIEDVVQLNAHLSKGKNIDKNLDLEKNLVLKGFRFEFSQIVTNLYVNALKYTPSGKVSVTWKRLNAKEGELIVKDSGIGIDPKYKHSIFDRFFRIPSKDNKRIGGTGLGLSIVKSLVEKMEGRVEVESELGSGSTIRVFLPLQK